MFRRKDIHMFKCRAGLCDTMLTLCTVTDINTLFAWNIPISIALQPLPASGCYSVYTKPIRLGSTQDVRISASAVATLSLGVLPIGPAFMPTYPGLKCI